MPRSTFRRTYYRHGSESPYYRVRISLNCPGAMGVCVDVLVMEKMLCIIARSGPGKRQLLAQNQCKPGEILQQYERMLPSVFIDRISKYSRSNNREDLQMQQEKFEFYKNQLRGDRIAWIYCIPWTLYNFWIIIPVVIYKKIF